MEPYTIVYKDTLSQVLCVVRAALFATLAVFVLCAPLGDPHVQCDKIRYDPAATFQPVCALCRFYWMCRRTVHKLLETLHMLFYSVVDVLYKAKLKVYVMVERLDHEDLCSVCRQNLMALSYAVEVSKKDVDRAIEDEITHKLGEDLVQSVEKKFLVDLEKSVDMVLMKIKLLLQNGTRNIQDKLEALQATLNDLRSRAPAEVENCLIQKHNETSALAEKALHQMVVCGYALIGQDPSTAINKVLTLKEMIRKEIEPINAQKKAIYELLRVCGHEHDSLKKVIKCVISKSPLVKSVMMEITAKLIDGVVGLTKMLAHGAMHEACLIEVVRSIEDEAVLLVMQIKKCTNKKNIDDEVENYIKKNNATIIDVKRDNEGSAVQDLLRRMLEDKDTKLDKNLKQKLVDLQNSLKSNADTKFKDVNNID